MSQRLNEILHRIIDATPADTAYKQCLEEIRDSPASVREKIYAVASTIVAMPQGPWTEDVLSIWETYQPGDASPVGDSLSKEIVAPWTPCADCGKVPDLILLTQNVTKCIPCFIKAAMNTPCFQCKKNRTEVIVRAISVEGKPDTVGVCMPCLKAHESTQRN